MRMQRRWLWASEMALGLVSFHSVIGATQDRPIIVKVEPAEVVRGDSVTVRGDNFPKEPGKIAVRLNDKELGSPSAVDKDGKFFVFQIPMNDVGEGTQKPFPLGWYTLRVVFKLDDGTGITQTAKVSDQEGRLQVVGDVGTKVKVTAVQPTVIYP